MGFYIEVDNNTEKLVNILKANPADVFGKPFGGYLLFLIGGKEKELIDWILENVIVLDSLTSDTIAFALFAREFNIEIKVPDFLGRTIPRDRLPKEIQVPLKDIKAFRSIDSFVKSGRCGWVVDGDKISAITYAVDDIAKNLGILGELPCVVVLDAIPKGTFELFPLEKSTIDRIIVLLRKSIQKLIDDKNYAEFKRNAVKIIEEERKLIRIQEQIRKSVSFINSFTFDYFLKKNDIGKVSFKKYLKNVWLVYFKNYIRLFAKSFSIDPLLIEKIFQIFDNSHSILRKYRDTIGHLDYYSLTSTWPLNEPWRSKYINAYEKYIIELLDNPPKTPDLVTPNQCREFIQELEEKQENLLNMIVSKVYQDSKFGDILEEIYSKKCEELKKRLILLTDEKDNLEKKFEKDAAALIDNCPSFLKYFKKEVRREKLKTVSLDIKSKSFLYAQSWLSPDNLSKLFNLNPI
jgi:hypothetical protein